MAPRARVVPTAVLAWAARVAAGAEQTVQEPAGQLPTPPAPALASWLAAPEEVHGACVSLLQRRAAPAPIGPPAPPARFPSAGAEVGGGPPLEPLEAAVSLSERDILREVDAEARAVDEQVRRKDARVRRDDAALHEENSRLRLALERFHNQTGLGNSTHRGGHQPNTSGGLRITKSTVIAIVGLVVAIPSISIAYQWYAHKSRRGNRQGGTEKRLEIYGVGLTTVRDFAILLAVSAFAGIYLWKQGIIQTYLGQLLCMFYVLAVVVGLLVLFLRQALSDFQNIHEDILKGIKKVENVFDGGLTDVPAVAGASWFSSPERPRRARR